MEPRIAEAAAIMTRFAERTGLTSELPNRRYLWTDAFAVCNLLGLGRATADRSWDELALLLVDRVHRTLGRHRDDDPRSGWVSGLDEEEGARHPTRGGLRIGKPLPERRADQAFDSQLEWERDGQYFHYLTQWMHALDQVAHATGEARYQRWGRELAVAAHQGFVVGRPGDRPRMVWKASIDLSRPLVPSMGHHDPLAGWIACVQLRRRRLAPRGDQAPGPPLDRELASFAALLEGQDWATDDPLGLGGLLADACRLGQVLDGAPREAPVVLERMLGGAMAGLAVYTRRSDLHAPATARLAFRELGLAIGLQAAEHLSREIADHPQRFAGTRTIPSLLREILFAGPLLDIIESFWRETAHQRAATWRDHLDINEVMLATSLASDGYLALDA